MVIVEVQRVVQPQTFLLQGQFKERQHLADNRCSWVCQWKHWPVKYVRMLNPVIVHNNENPYIQLSCVFYICLPCLKRFCNWEWISFTQMRNTSGWRLLYRQQGHPLCIGIAFTKINLYQVWGTLGNMSVTGCVFPVVNWWSALRGESSDMKHMRSDS